MRLCGRCHARLARAGPLPPPRTGGTTNRNPDSESRCSSRGQGAVPVSCGSTEIFSVPHQPTPGHPFPSLAPLRLQHLLPRGDHSSRTLPSAAPLNPGGGKACVGTAPQPSAHRLHGGGSSVCARGEGQAGADAGLRFPRPGNVPPGAPACGSVKRNAGVRPEGGCPPEGPRGTGDGN